MKILNSMNSALLLFCALVFFGCGKLRQVESNSNRSFDSNLILARASFLPAAEKRLLEAIGGQRIAMLGALSYIAEDPAYLIIDAVFYTDFGSVSEVFVMRLTKATDPWDTAEVYRWKSTKVEYVDYQGKKINRHLMYPSELIALPERVRTNLLGSIESAPWYKGPKSDDDSDPKKERNYVY